MKTGGVNSNLNNVSTSVTESTTPLTLIFNPNAVKVYDDTEKSKSDILKD
jgi:hypothetical protein